ncbi:helix-turn-helix domain-containing protein [Caproiciproducens galactitolivorans]|uniref:LexA repressor n=1 Tax=Caproiciproducens galactitolivorans TaxID=642589 RepID=A0A4Z0Y7N6_9FIRM|nr:LexA family transcriptional regulator [Caproiciproducens galactitolivorans]QEY33839.1 helix-turn-helix domain-containing protein [Caproiciproducens galactitolivorans]TGJ75535.1 LexA repressor [Caproiciproducens galactitolivorans]
MNNIEIGKKLYERRMELHLTLQDVAKIVGVASSTIQRYETGNVAKIKMPVLESISKALKLNPAWVCGKDSNKFIDDSLPSNCTPLSSLPMIPVVGKIAAGQPILAQESIIGYIPTDIKNPDEYFYLHVEGDSMINAGIENGSDVLIRKQNCAENGQIVACFVNGDSATLKRFKQIGDTIFLIPENSNYEPIIVKCYDFENGYARILGVAVRCVTTKEL